MLRIFSLCLLFITQQAPAQNKDQWNLRDSNDGVNIYTKDNENSKIKTIKVECELEATLSQLVAVLVDVKSSDEWLYHTSSTYVVKTVSPTDFYYYSRVELPWPLSDRDFIAHIKVSQDPASKVVTIDAPCVADLVPEKPKTVRVSNSDGKWVITPAGKNKIKVVYTLHTDPGGSVPSWLINMFVTQGPSQSFKKLKVHVQKPVFKNARLTYIVNER